MTQALQIDPTQIAELIATRLASDATFRTTLASAIAREYTRNLTEKPDEDLRRAYSEMTRTAMDKLRESLEATTTRLRKEGEETLSRQFKQSLTTKAGELLTPDWIQGQAKKAIHNHIMEAFGRKAHEIATSYLQSNQSKLALIAGPDGGE